MQQGKKIAYQTTAKQTVSTIFYQFIQIYIAYNRVPCAFLA